MSERTRIDWQNLPPLPRKKPDGATREDAAERLFRDHKAKHNGRNHIRNWERRQIARAAAMEARKRADKATARARRFIDAVRAYWKGDTDEHP